MDNRPSSASWAAYRERELTWAKPALAVLGYELEELQPHLGGERFLMQAVTTASGPKLILLVRRARDGMRAVAKVTSDAGGIRELVHERLCRNRLADIKFAYRGFLVPQELHFEARHGRALSLQAFIEQDMPFLARPIEEQFSLALSGFKTQEGAHAATYEQARSIARTFGIMHTDEYLARYRTFRAEVSGQADDVLLGTGEAFLTENRSFIEQYGGFLTHTDFVPHNVRIVGTDIYLLDASSLRFGNKYEGWARFLNFMELYHPELKEALVRYVADNRAPEETAALRAMRVYRLGEIIAYYGRATKRSEGALEELNAARVHFWSDALRAVLTNTPLPEAVRTGYQTLRDRLRSPEEKLRQKGLH